MLLRYVNIALAPGLLNFIESFLAWISEHNLLINNGLGSDTLWAGFGSGREVRLAQFVAML
jgi:hypothetical protein